MTATDQQLMQCMEVWGGSEETDRGVVMAGLDAWVYSKPYGQASGGGDVYYVSSCATGRILRLLLADVSGHGQAVQGVASELRRLMRRYVNHLDQNQFVGALNRQFGALAQAGSFATAVVSTFFAPTGRLTLCNAGHPPPLLYRSSTRKWSYLDPVRQGADGPLNLPLGILEMSDYRTSDVELRTGDLVLCYSDALTESHGADGQMLGQEGLLKIVESLDVSSPAAIVPSLLAALEGASAANLTADDVTVMLFRPNGLGRRRPSLRQQVVALGKMSAAVARRLTGGEQVPWPDFSLPNVGGALFARLQRKWRA